MFVTTDPMTARVQAIKDGNAIPGLLFSLSGKRLAEHCRKRAGYHETRAGEKQAEIPKMEAAIEKMRESITTIKGFASEGGATAVTASSYTKAAGLSYGFQGSDQVAELEKQIESLKGDIKNHRNKGAAFLFMAESFFDFSYTLEWADLVRLEAVPQ